MLADPFTAGYASARCMPYRPSALSTFNAAMRKSIRGISSEAILLMEHYRWPGNVRELENTIERAVALEKGDEISPACLPDRIVHGCEVQSSLVHLPEEGLDLEQHIRQIERSLIEAALARANGVRTNAANLLKMTYRSFRHYAKKYGI
jgi:two-component system response regulator PilR (NtrC family)